MQGLCDLLTRRVHLLIYIYIYIKCNCMQGLYAWLTRWVHQNRACFSKTIDLRGHMPRFSLKCMFFHLSPSKPCKCVLKPSEHGSFFQDDRFERSYSDVYCKNACFAIYLLGNTINVCWNPQNRAHFSKMIDLRGHMPRVYYNNECFPIYLLGICINGCWNSQKRPCFSKMIDLRGHMPRFSWKMNIFPSICLETTWMGVGTLRTVLVFPRWLIWGVTYLGLLSKWTFSHPSLEKPHKCVLKPAEQGSFFWDDRFEGSHA